ncbi:MAG: hypothetical protein JW790_05535 [Dehalococcoidales bacterium]|nr:hypothetical protein [Dehalococcoidales bacterium]
MRLKKPAKSLIGIMLAATMVLTTPIAPVLASGEFPLEPDDPVISDAVGYFADVQDTNTGAIGTYSDSGWVIMAIAAAGEDPNDFGDPSVVDFVKENAAELASEFNLGTAYARIVLAAVAAGDDPAAFGPGDPSTVTDGDYLGALKALHNGTQFTDGTGATDTLNDDFWALIALAAAGEDPESAIVTSTVDFILFNQNEDGGWGWATVDNEYYSGSDVDDTAAAIMALAAVGFDMTSDEIQNADYGALSYLQNNQDSSGGFLSWGAVSLASTTWAVDAIAAADGNPIDSQWAPDGTDPIEFIMTYNQTDGSFLDSSAYTPNPQKNTADAIVSLTGNPFPITPQYMMAGEQSTTASVSVSEYISISLTGGIDFGTLKPGEEEQGATGQSDGSPAIAITVEGETNVTVDIGIKGDTTGDIPLGDWKYSATFAGTKTGLSSSYNKAHDSVGDGSYPFYHWISIPSDAAAGSYQATVYYKAVNEDAAFE